jgi:hypothetical protein
VASFVGQDLYPELVEKAAVLLERPTGGSRPPSIQSFMGLSFPVGSVCRFLNEGR